MNTQDFWIEKWFFLWMQRKRVKINTDFTVASDEWNVEHCEQVKVVVRMFKWLPQQFSFNVHAIPGFLFRFHRMPKFTAPFHSPKRSISFWILHQFAMNVQASTKYCWLTQWGFVSFSKFKYKEREQTIWTQEQHILMICMNVYRQFFSLFQASFRWECKQKSKKMQRSNVEIKWRK